MAKREKLSLDELLEQAIVRDEDKPYEVPRNWIWTRLENLVSVLGDGLHGTPIYSELGDYYFINGNNLNNGFIDFKDNAKKVDVKEFLKYKKPLNDRTVFVSINGTLGNVAFYNNEKVILGKSACYFNLYEKISKKYILFLVKSEDFINYANIVATGSTIKNVSLKSMREYIIPLPPLPEQQRIVILIESLFEKLDRAKELAQNALDCFENRKSAILHKALTGELTEKWRDKHGVGMESWEEKLISDICDIVRGGSPRPAGDPQYYCGIIPFMKVADITRNYGPYIDSAEYSIKEAGLKKTRMVGANTLLLTNSGATLGVPAICTFPTTFNDGIAAFLNLNERSLKFFYYFWTSKTSELRGINKGAAQPNINTDIIGTVKINLPSITEQQEIVRILDNLLENEQKAKELCDVIDKIDLMKKSILARAFRGELSTNNPDEESSLELLKEVLQERVED